MDAGPLRLSNCTALRTLVLYFVLCGRLHANMQGPLYASLWHLLSPSRGLLSTAPPGLPRIELRFQRYGRTARHMQSALGVLRALASELEESWWLSDMPEFARPALFDAGCAERFAGLERFTCVLWDDGYARRFAGCLQDGGQEEPRVEDGLVQGDGWRFEEYADFLAGLWPGMHERGVLKFERGGGEDIV